MTRARFAEFAFDLKSHELLQSGVRVRLQHQPAEILAILLAASGAVVSREQLKKTLWNSGVHLDFDHSLDKSISKLRALLGDDSSRPRFIETLSRRGYRFVAPVQFFEEGAPRLLVFPFEIDNPVYGYISEAIYEGLVKWLGRVGEAKLSVIAPPILQRQQRSRTTLNRLANELKVDYFLRGDLNVADGRIYLNVELGRAADGGTAWEGNFEGDLTHVLGLVAELATNVANSLSVYLPATTCCSPASNKVSTLYLQARQLSEKRDEVSVKKALDLFHKVTELDPGCAVAYASIAKCYLTLSLRAYLPNAQAKPAARSAALYALLLDDSIAEAYAALGWVDITFEHNWMIGLAQLETAVKIDPASAFAHFALGRALIGTGRFADAISSLQRALEEDPLSGHTKSVLLWAFVCARRYDEAVALADETLILHEMYGGAWAAAAMAYAAAGHFEKAVQTAERSIRLWSRDHPVLWVAADVFAQAGLAGKAEALLREIPQEGKEICFPTFLAASAWLHLGNQEMALELLERAYEERCDGLSWIKVDPRFDQLRGNPKFEEIVRKMHFPEP